MSYKNSCVNFDAFSDKMAHLFFLKIETFRSESVNEECNERKNNITPTDYMVQVNHLHNSNT